MFRHTLRGVIRMDPKQMALNDGSKSVAGRGSGEDLLPGRLIGDPKYEGVPFVEGGKRKGGFRPQVLPFAQMTFAPLERRLDTAVYRALFASSIRQARMMCLHGKVMVNGVKVCSPSFPHLLFNIIIGIYLYIFR